MYKTSLKFISLNLGYIIVATIISWLMLKFHFTHIIPDNSNLLNWDAKWYNSIRESGYIYIENAQCNLAFFPLFPFLWSILDFSPIWMSIFNALLFFYSFYLLLRKEEFSYLFFIFLLSMPPFIFFYLPYSESLFFFSSVLIIIGYKNNSEGIKLLGFFFSSMVRSVSVIFIPAIIICEFLVPLESADLKKRFLRAAVSSLASLSGLAVIIVVQGLQTGKWFYFTTVLKYWDRKWIIPGFPLTTGNTSTMLAIDGIAFIIGLTAILFCIKWAFDFLFSDRDSRKIAPAHIVFSALFLSAITILDTFHTNNDNNSANLWSLHRHLVTTAFAVTFLHWLFQYYNPKITEKIFWSILILSGVFMTRLYEYPILTTYYLGFFVVFICLKIKLFKPVFLFIPLVCQLVIQLLILEVFLSFNWVG